MFIHRVDGTVAFQSRFSIITKAIQEMVERGLSLCGIDLSGADLSGLTLNKANCDGICLDGADLSGSKLRNVSMRNSNLRKTNFSFSSFQDVNVFGSEVGGSDFSSADVKELFFDDEQTDYMHAQSVDGILPDNVSVLEGLRDKPDTVVHLFKLVNAENESPFVGKIRYTPGEVVSVDKVNEDPKIECGEGINIATLSWCISKWQKEMKIMKVGLLARDLVCIPTKSSGKIRVAKCRVLEEQDILKLGLK